MLHICVPQDELIEPAADSVNLNGVLASATLAKKPSERIINPKLQQQVEPPWGNMDVKDWAQTYVAACPPRAVCHLKGPACTIV